MRPEVQVLPGPPPAFPSRNDDRRVQSWLGWDGCRIKTSYLVTVPRHQGDGLEACRLAPKSDGLQCFHYKARSVPVGRLGWRTWVNRAGGMPPGTGLSQQVTALARQPSRAGNQSTPGRSLPGQSPTPMA